MTATARLARSSRSSRTRAAVIVGGAALIAVALNALVSWVAVSWGAPATYGPLTLPAHGLFTVLGVVGGWVGWMLVRRRAQTPDRMLRLLVPVVTLVSFVPDVLLLAFGFIPGTTTLAVLALMVMHIVVVAVAVPAYVLASRGPRG
ncbi:DUF6069 family protein [Microbacterium sp. NPDC008134]|uniref:DUF6069 family protein n=1 Tax=Microbacterium sp. NPDC008134 TaxID=3364183 RepID=UPI0036E88011